MMKYNLNTIRYYIKTAAVICVFLLFFSLSPEAKASENEWRGIEGGGSGEVAINPKRVETGKLCDISLTITFPNNDTLYEVQIKVPYSWRFTPNYSNVRLEGMGMEMAAIKEISGGGYQNQEYIIKITGASITTGKAGQVSLLNITPPSFIASDRSSLNRFAVITRRYNGILAQIDNSPICETYNMASYAPVLLINETAPKNSPGADFVEVYCKDDGNFGNGVDIINWQLSRMSESITPDKTFASMIVKTGNYLVLRYNSANQADDIFPSLNVLNAYSGKTSIGSGSFIMTLKNLNGQITDALVCNTMADDVSYNDILYLNSLKQWEGVDKKAGVSIASIAANNVVARFPGRADTNARSDFSLMNYQTPGASNGNLGIAVKLLVNEFKAGSNNGDFIEIFVSDDGSGGGGSDISGYEISDGVDFSAVCPQGTIVRSGDYIVIKYNSSASGFESRLNNVISVNTTVTGLSKVFGLISIRNSALKYIDAAAYSSGPISEKNRLILKKFVESGDILDMTPPLVYDDEDCVSIKNQAVNSSFGRNEKSADTNSRTDFSNFVKPTPGRPNVAAGYPIALVTDPGPAIYANANSEVVVDIKAVDVDGLVSQVGYSLISVTSDAEGTLFSENGLDYSPKIEVTLRYGTRRIYIKDTTISSKTITFKDKFDPKLACKLNFVVTALFPVQINEIMYNPTAVLVKNPLDLQWIELYNKASSYYDISGYKFKCGNKVYVFPDGTKIESNSYLAVTTRLNKASYREEAAFSDVYGDADGVWRTSDGFTALASNGFTIGTGGGRLSFTTPDDIELSVVEYSSSQGGNGNGKSIEKSIQSVYSIGSFDVDRYNFVESGKSYGTPGKQNSKDSRPATKITLSHSPVEEAIVNQSVTIYARVENANEIDVGYRNSRVAGIYSYIPMKKVDNTNVYRAIIPAISVTLDGVDYYVRVLDSERTAAYAPDGGEGSPYKISVIDNTPKISIVTPSKLVAPGESFFVDVNIENAPNISDVSFDIYFNSKYLTVEDQDAVRPGSQIAVGSVFSQYFNEVNDTDQTAGVINFKLVDQTGASGPSGQAARIKFRSAASYGETYPEYIDLQFKNVVVSSSPDVSVFDGKVQIGDRSSGIAGIAGGIVGGENQARIIIPAGAVKTDTAFTIKKLIKSEIPRTNVIDNMNGIKSLDVAYDFGPDGYNFQKPVTIEIPFTSADLAAKNISDPKNLKIYYYNTANLAYEKMGGIVSGGKVSVKVNHLSLYLLVEDLSKEEFDLNTIFVSPNPFSPNDNGWNDSTFINYTTTVDTIVTIKIFDVRGAPVRKLLSGEAVSGGRNKAEWDGRDDFGRIVKTGVYLYQLKTVSPQKSSRTFQGTIVVSKNLKD